MSETDNLITYTSKENSTFVYDGDGKRVKKTEAGETILYVNKYFEKNLTTGENTTYYYLGDKLVAKRTGTTLNYIHQDHLGGTSLITGSDGSLLASTMYYPYGERLKSEGDLGTDKLFTGQRLDNTGLYYYGARYYDASIGRFISPDVIVQNPGNPQNLNRYSYVLNNPLKYVDPSGLYVEFENEDEILGYLAEQDAGYTFNDEIQQMIEEYLELRYAWYVLEQNEPELVGFLRDDPGTVVIRSGVMSLAYSAAETSVYNGNVYITVGSFLANQPRPIDYVASLLGHESVHAIARLVDQRSGDSIFEEALGFMVANRVAKGTGFQVDWWSDLMPQPTEMLNSNRGIFQSMYNVKYDVKTGWRSEDKLWRNYGNLRLLPSPFVQDALQRKVIAGLLVR